MKTDGSGRERNRPWPVETTAGLEKPGRCPLQSRARSSRQKPAYRITGNQNSNSPTARTAASSSSRRESRTKASARAIRSGSPTFIRGSVSCAVAIAHSSSGVSTGSTRCRRDDLRLWTNRRSKQRLGPATADRIRQHCCRRSCARSSSSAGITPSAKAFPRGRWRM